MNEQACVFLLAVSYAVLIALHLALLAHVRLRLAGKVLSVAAMTALSIATFYAMQGRLGWSAAVAVPERFKIVATRVVEPDHQRDRPGAIHLWLEALDDRNIPSGVPRAYMLPYSVGLAAKVAHADSEIKKGNAQGGTASILNSDFGEQVEGANVRTIAGGLGSGGDPSGGGALSPSLAGGQSSSINLISLPPPLLPPKD